MTQNKQHTLWVERYRPVSLENYIGNELLKTKVSKYISTGDIPHLLLHGKAGTGKTTLITEIMKHNNIFKKKIVLSATTNKAVSVIQKMFEAAPKNVHFSTIHKLMQIKRKINMDGSESYVINIDESPNQKKKSIYFYDIIVIDEASMISKDLVSEIISVSSKIKGQIIFVGDTLQLPPINDNTFCLSSNKVKL